MLYRVSAQQQGKVLVYAMPLGNIPEHDRFCVPQQGRKHLSAVIAGYISKRLDYAVRLRGKV